jgi:hypothetical protein
MAAMVKGIPSFFARFARHNFVTLATGHGRVPSINENSTKKTILNCVTVWLLPFFLVVAVLLLLLLLQFHEKDQTLFGSYSTPNCWHSEVKW